MFFAACGKALIVGVSERVLAILSTFVALLLDAIRISRGL